MTAAATLSLPSSAPARWTLAHPAAAITIVGLSAMVTLDAWKDILHLARRDEESSYVFLAPLIAVWLLWLRKSRLKSTRPVGTWLGPVLVAMGWAAYSIGDWQLWQSIWHGGAVLLAVGCLICVIGSDVLRRLLPAFLVLVFLIPVPARLRQAVSIPLETATARTTQHLFDLIGVNVTRSGNVLSIDGVDVGIAEACNGLRMVFSLLLACYAFAFAMPLTWPARILVIALSPLAAIIANVIRLVPTVWIYSRTSEAAAEQFHVISGWIMLVVAFLGLMGLMRLLHWASVPVLRPKLA